MTAADLLGVSGALPKRIGDVLGDMHGGRRPNQVHAFVTRKSMVRRGRLFVPEYDFEDLGISENLKTNVGNDWLSGVMGDPTSTPNASSSATSTSATSLTNTGAAWTTSQWIGAIVVAGTVFGRINANTATVLTVDAWLNADGTAGSTPGGTSNYLIVPGFGAAVYIALTTNAGAPAAGDTTLTGEITTNGLQRAIATMAHTGSAASYALSKVFTASGTHTAVHKGGLFTNLTGGLMAFETVLNSDATLNSGDTLTITWTVNI